MDREIEIQLDFTDVTMAEADGDFEEVKDIMIQEVPYDDSWMIRSTITITSEFGVGVMVVHFFGTGKILIMEYNPSVNDVFYNPDVRAFCTWSQDFGWNIPQPSIDLAKKDKEFWKYFWDTLLIDSDYFDKAYGKRDVLDGEE
jgi:hypothetical protein